MKLIGPYSAFLFDFDGVLGKTMEDNFHAWKHALTLAGASVQSDQYFVLEGSRPIEIAEYFLRKSGLSPENAASVALEKDRYYSANNQFKLYDGAMDLLHRLKQSGMKLALVSGATRKRLETTVSNEFLGFFQVVVTADDVSQGKPNPECYRRCIQELGLQAPDCVVIENAPFGIAAAKTAGIDCIAITSTLEPKALSGADLILANLNEVAGLLDRQSDSAILSRK